MDAFALIHFGDKKKYLELEIYTILMIRKNSTKDILYLYSINDTPNDYLKIIESLGALLIPYDDKGLTYNVKNFNSYYTHFNTLRTCNFLFAFQLTQYRKICIMESDMVIMNNIDSLFDNKCPSILFYDKSKKLSMDRINSNYLSKIDKKEVLDKCNEGSLGNGGVLLIKPSLKDYNALLKNLKTIITHNCTFPNETLFLYTLKNIYNLPIIYNMIQYIINDYPLLDNKVLIYHFNHSIYKPLNIIKNKYIEKEKKYFKKKVILFFKKNYYDIYNKKIEELMKYLK